MHPGRTLSLLPVIICFAFENSRKFLNLLFDAVEVHVLPCYGGIWQWSAAFETDVCCKMLQMPLVAMWLSAAASQTTDNKPNAAECATSV